MKTDRKSFVFLLGGLLILVTLACSAGPLTSFFITPTPTPTNTPTSTSTPTITPSPTPTITPSPTLTPTPVPTGVQVNEHADGSLLIVDYDNYYQLTLPADWVVIPLTKDEMGSLIDKLAEKDTKLADAAKAFSSLASNVMRVLALNKDEKYRLKGFVTNINVIAIEDKMMSTMPMSFVTGALEESMKDNSKITIITQGDNTKTNTSGVEIGMILAEQQAPVQTSGKVTVRQSMFLFQVNGRLVLITLTAPKQISISDEYLNAIVESIKLLK